MVDPIPPSAADRRLLLPALLVYAAVAVPLALAQADCVNADFVAYAAIARGAADGAPVVTAYWSPLFAWCIAPLLWLGIGEPVAGRAVLLAAGAAYVVAVHRLLQAVSPPTLRCRRQCVAVVLTCAVLQAVVAASHLLDPDLLAFALAFAALARLLAVRTGTAGALGAGVLAGTAYLAKAYMLPFLLLAGPLALWWLRRPFWRCAVPFAVAALGVAVPWIAVLTSHCGELVMSSAGPANHANVGPGVLGKDLLWRPPLDPGFYLEPRFGPDWSPLQSWSAFAHQLYLVVRNLGRSFELLAGWVVLVLVAAVARWRGGAVAADAAAARRPLWFAVGATALYLAGYLTIRVESRYLTPVMAPLLCMAAVLLAPRLERWSMRACVALVLVFGAQELKWAAARAAMHLQLSPLGPSRAVAAELQRLGATAGPFAASHWQHGLIVAYAGGASAHYLGTPYADTAEQRSAALRAAGARWFLRFVPPESSDCGGVGDGWRLVATVPFGGGGRQVEVLATD